jgi:hypothetical protein
VAMDGRRQPTSMVCRCRSDGRRGFGAAPARMILRRRGRDQHDLAATQRHRKFNNEACHEQAINCDDGDRAARIIQDVLGIESDDVVNKMSAMAETCPTTAPRSMPSATRRDLRPAVRVARERFKRQSLATLLGSFAVHGPPLAHGYELPRRRKLPERELPAGLLKAPFHVHSSAD